MRDRALLAIGMAGVFRRSELVALCLADVEWVKEGLRVTIRRGKTDQEGAGATIAIPEDTVSRCKWAGICRQPPKFATRLHSSPAVAVQPSSSTPNFDQTREATPLDPGLNQQAVLRRGQIVCGIQSRIVMDAEVAVVAIMLAVSVGYMGGPG